MGLTWFSLTIVDVGVLSISLIGLVWMYRTLKKANEKLQQQVEEVLAENAELKQENEELKQQVEEVLAENAELKQQFREFQSTADRRYNALQEESENRYNALQEKYENLRQENEALRKELDEVKRDNQALRNGFNQMMGRYKEIKGLILSGRLK